MPVFLALSNSLWLSWTFDPQFSTTNFACSCLCRALHGHEQAKLVVKKWGPRFQDNQRELESAEKTGMHCFYWQSWYLESKKLAQEK